MIGFPDAQEASCSAGGAWHKNTVLIFWCTLYKMEGKIQSMCFRRLMWIVLLLPLFLPQTGGAEGDKDPILNYASLENPFRMQKCNLAWDKARTKPLQEAKLKLLYYELKLQDKEEIALKKLKSEMGDKDGLREADVRKKFNGILNSYGLKKQDSSSETEDLKLNHRLFKDKKLDRLWEKAHQAGLDGDELMLLKKEFQHHQDKVDEYHRLKEMAATTGIGTIIQ